jgi:hypothetical protein
MELPPTSDGGVNVTVAEALPRVAVPIVGGAGIAAGEKAPDAADGALDPRAFCAVTVHVYVFVFVRPDTTMGLDDPACEPAKPPLVEVHDTV